MGQSADGAANCNGSGPLALIDGSAQGREIHVQASRHCTSSLAGLDKGSHGRRDPMDGGDQGDGGAKLRVVVAAAPSGRGGPPSFEERYAAFAEDGTRVVVSPEVRDRARTICANFDKVRNGKCVSCPPCLVGGGGARPFAPYLIVVAAAHTLPPGCGMQLESLQADRRHALKIKLDERLWSAACWRDYQLGCVQRAFDTEVSQITKDFNSDKLPIKEKVIGDLVEYKKRIIAAHQSAKSDDAGMATSLPTAELQ